MATTPLILVVDDETLLLQHVEQIIEEAGYTVLTASGAQEALALIDAHQAALAGLVTDVRLGKSIDGWQVAQHGRELMPELAVVYMTGDGGGDWPAKGVPASVVVNKPFAPAQLITALSTLINAAGYAG